MPRDPPVTRATLPRSVFHVSYYNSARRWLRSTVAIVGAGELGGLLAHALARAERGAGRSASSTRTAASPQGKALDIMQAAPVEGFASNVSGSTDSPRIAGADDRGVIADRVRRPANRQGDAAHAAAETASRLSPRSRSSSAPAPQTRSHRARRPRTALRRDGAVRLGARSAGRRRARAGRARARRRPERRRRSRFSACRRITSSCHGRTPRPAASRWRGCSTSRRGGGSTRAWPGSGRPDPTPSRPRRPRSSTRSLRGSPRLLTCFVAPDDYGGHARAGRRTAGAARTRPESSTWRCPS